jgi:hypothetical protein
MSFSEAINKAETSSEAEKNGDAPRAQANPVAFEPRKMEEEDNEEDDGEEVELRIAGSFSFENVGGGAAQAAGGAGTYRRCDRRGRHAREFVAGHAAAMKVRRTT